MRYLRLCQIHIEHEVEGLVDIKEDVDFEVGDLLLSVCILLLSFALSLEG